VVGVDEVGGLGKDGKRREKKKEDEK